MNPNNNSLDRASMFVAGVATAVIVVNFLLSFLRRAVLFSPEGGVGLIVSGYSFNWLLTVPAYLATLSLFLLAVWAGHLLSRAFRNPPRWAVVLLCILAACGVILFIPGAGYLPKRFFGGALLFGGVCGYLVRLPEAEKRRTAESLVMALLCALMFAGLFVLDRHHWLILPAMAAFSYFVLILAYSPEVQDIVSRKWVKPTVAVLSVLSLLIAIWHLIDAFAYMNYRCLTPVWAVLLQPAILWLILKLFRAEDKTGK